LAKPRRVWLTNSRPGSPARLQHGHEHFLGASTCPGAVPTPYLPVHHRRPDRSLDLPFGRLDLGMAQEGELTLGLALRLLEAGAGRFQFASEPLVLLAEPLDLAAELLQLL
jgi:hypothetical protein